MTRLGARLKLRELLAPIAPRVEREAADYLAGMDKRLAAVSVRADATVLHVPRRRSRLAVQRDRAVDRRLDPEAIRPPDVVGLGGADEAALSLAPVPVVRADLVGGEPPRVAGLDDPGPLTNRPPRGSRRSGWR